MCIDFTFAVIFTAILVAILGSAVVISLFSNIQLVFANYDCSGNVCGRMRNVLRVIKSVNMTDKKLVMHSNFFNPELSVPICVENCNDVAINNKEDLFEYLKEKNTSICDCRVPWNLSLSHLRIGNVPLCPELPIAATTAVNGVCTPKHYLSGPHAKRKERNSELSLSDDFDVGLPWFHFSIGLLLSILLSYACVICLVWSPSKIIMITTVLLNVSFGAVSILFISRIALQSRLPYRLSSWPSDFFHTMERSNSCLFTVLVVVNLLSLSFVVLVTVKIWRPNSEWRLVHLRQTQVILDVVSTVIRELPCIILLEPFIRLASITAYTCVFGIILVSISSTVEPIRSSTTGCFGYRTYSWNRYGFIPIFCLFSIWIYRYLSSLVQTVTITFVTSWYNAPAPRSHQPIGQILASSCQRLAKVAVGSLSLASLASLLCWLPSRFFGLFRMLAKSDPLETGEEPKSFTERLFHKVSTIECRLRELECNTFTMIVTEEKSFEHCQALLSSEMCGQELPGGLTNFMRWPEIIFEFMKLTSTNLATVAAFSWFTTKPPAIHAFPFMILLALALNYLVSSVVISTLQNTLSTILVLFCTQENEYYSQTIGTGDVLVGFRHEELKNQLLPNSQDAYEMEFFDSVI